MTERASFQEGKFLELVLYIAHRSAGFPHFGRTKLAKDLFFADFRAFRELGESITGATYKKARFGPLADKLLPSIDTLVASGAAVEGIFRSQGLHEQKRLMALRDADMRDFKGPEMVIIQNVIDDLRDLTSEEVSLLSHEFPGWKLAAMDEVIPYETVYLADPDDPPRASDEDLKLLREHILKRR